MIFFPIVTPSSYSLKSVNKYLLSPYHVEPCPTYWGFSGDQKTKSTPSLSFYLSGGRQIVLKKYILYVTDNTLWRKTNNKKELENEREWVLFWIWRSEKIALGRKKLEQRQRSGAKSVIGRRNRTWIIPEAGVHGCVWRKSRMSVGLGVQWLSWAVVRKWIDKQPGPLQLYGLGRSPDMILSIICYEQLSGLWCKCWKAKKIKAKSGSKKT